MERFIKREIPQVTEEDIASSQHGMLFLELYIRTYYREKVVRQLVDSGVKVYAFGKQWEQLKCEHPENLIASGRMMNSRECVEVIRNSKIALNAMPWFKDGAHDRIFTAMLNGAVALTDDSIYLNEILTDGKNTMFYYLDRLEELPDRVNGLLEQPQNAMAMIEDAYSFASQFHTWKQRALELYEYISDSNKTQ
jgi:glycosyltransferase involved in cell wall biosynthesis